MGNSGEQQSVDYLLLHGYTILARQYRTKSNKGEIDIIVKKNDVIAFLEVKTRTNKYNISILELISKRKQLTIISIAMYYCQLNSISLQDYIIRFDLIYIIDGQLSHYENAFTL